MKWVLPAAAAVLLGVVLAWPGAVDQVAAEKLTSEVKREGQVESLTMLKPRYRVSDSDNRPFTITAESATHDPADQRRVMLDRLRADITMTNGTGVFLTADGGVYHQVEMTLHLDGPVRIESDSGYEFRAGDVAVDLAAGTAVTNAPVQGEGPVGRLRADRLRIKDRGQNLHFTDNVSVTYYPKRAE